MTDETKTPQQEEQKPTEQKSQKVHRKQPVVIYMVILMAVVVIMLLFSYVMQARSSQQLENLTSTVEGLEDNYTTLERINEMQGTIDTLSSQVNTLEDELEEANETISSQQEELDSLNEEKSSSALENEALSYLAALQKAYAEQNYDQCKSILSAMEDTEGLIAALPTSAELGDVVTYSPKDLYTEIAEDVAASASAGDSELSDTSDTADTADTTDAEDPENGEKTDNMGSPDGN